MFLSCQVSDRNYMTNIQKHFLNTQTIFLLSLKKVNVMKIKLSKNYLNHTAGDTIEVTRERGGYLVRVGVGEVLEGKKETKELKQNYINKPKDKKRNPKS